MPKHIITRTYENLKGFSTDSIYLRPPNVAQDAINIHRDPDGTFTPRRGFQCETADIGGLGLASFDNPCRCGIELVCVHRDGNLYRRLSNQINISYSTAYPEAWFQFNIFTNPNIFNNSPGWGFEPWALTPWSSPSGESITFDAFIKSAAIVDGTQTDVTTINVDAGHLIVTGNTIIVMNQETRRSQLRTVTGTTPTSVTFSGGTLSVNNNDRIDIFYEQLFGRGFDVTTAYPVSQFITFLNTITGVTAFAEGPTDFPAAFIPIQEFENLVSGASTQVTYYYWEQIPTPVDPVLPGSASIKNQNSASFENASFCVFDEVLYCTNGYDFVVKYDGQNVYLAGMPKGDRPFVSTVGAGPLTAGDYYFYAITYEQKDNATHLIEGQVSDSFEYKVGMSDESTEVKINDLNAASRYNTNGALADGSADAVYGPDVEGNYYHYIGTLPGQTFIVGDTAYYQDRAIAIVNWGIATPFDGTNLPVDPGYGILVGDYISFEDNAGNLRRRQVEDIDTTVSPNQIEISGGAVDTSNNPSISAYIESPVFGHIGIADGDQVNVTVINLLVNGPVENSLAIGDLITFTDNDNNIIKRTVTNRTSSTITVDHAITIEDGTLITSDTIDTDQITLKSTKQAAILTNINDPMSNNLRINIYRSHGSSDKSLTALSLVESIPNDSFSASQTFLDELSDGELDLQIKFPNPQQVPSPPPKCKYLLSYQNMIIYAGGSRNAQDTEWSLDAFYFSKGDEPEAVPAATNFQLVPSNDDVISGVGQSGTSLIIGKDRSLYAISGDLLTSQFQVVPIAPGSNIGVAAHATMRPVGGLLYFLSNTNGVYALAETQMFPTDAEGDPIPLTKPIDVLFRSKPFDKDKQFVLKRAVAMNYTPDNEYWLFLPCEDSSSAIRDANSNSIILCLDYMEKNWFLWRNINAAGGFALVGDQAFWQERRFSGFVSDTANLYRQHRNFRLIDYADHTQTIPVFWSSGWEDLKYPQVRKKFIRAMLYFDRIDSLYQLNEPFLFFSTYVDRFPNNRSTYAPVTTVNNSVPWGAAWSWKPWAGAVDPFISVTLKNGTVAKSMQLSLEMNKLNTSFKFNGFQLEISPEYDKTFVR